MSGGNGQNLWFALRTKPRHEKAVAMGLRGRGLEGFLPLVRVRHRWSDRSKELEIPLFPSYVFCRFALEGRQPVLSTPGVVCIVGLGRTPVPVEDGEIEGVQKIVQSGLEAQPWPFLRVGQMVRIDDGPLSGCERILLEFKGRRRLVLSITLLERSVAVEIDRPAVSPCPRRPTPSWPDRGPQRLAA